MNQAQKVIAGFFIIALLIIAVLLGVYFYKLKNANNDVCNPTAYEVKENNLSLETIFYYGSTCPHCKLVEEFMKNNNIENKINISQREVYGNKTAADEMMALQKLGNLPVDYVGAVPIFYYNKTLYLGDKDIICVLKKLIGEKS